MLSTCCHPPLNHSFLLEPQLRVAIEKMNAGTLLPRARPGLGSYQPELDTQATDEADSVLPETVVETPSSKPAVGQPKSPGP